MRTTLTFPGQLKFVILSFVQQIWYKCQILIVETSVIFAGQLAIEYSVKFLETSAKASINVEEAFFTLARDIKAKMDKKLVSVVDFVTE